jgi:alpha-beta hydrolase superfamily lysophospholipase
MPFSCAESALNAHGLADQHRAWPHLGEIFTRDGFEVFSKS